MKHFISFLLVWAMLCGTAHAGPPQRIVSLAPNLTEILYDMGLGDRIVAVTDFCDYPPEVKKSRRSAASRHLRWKPWRP
jgi:ABC-type hemin transport system substrate-binding protein